MSWTALALNYKKYFESDLANELGCLIRPKDGKKYIIKLFELFIDNIDNKYELDIKNRKKLIKKVNYLNIDLFIRFTNFNWLMFVVISIAKTFSKIITWIVITIK